MPFICESEPNSQISCFILELLMVISDHHQKRLAQLSYPRKFRMRICSLKHIYDHNVIIPLRLLIIESLPFFMYDSIGKNSDGLLKAFMKFLIHGPEND